MKGGMTASALRSQYAAETENGAGYLWSGSVQILEAGKEKKTGGNKAVLALLLALALTLVGSAAFFLIISRDGGPETTQSTAAKPGKQKKAKEEERPERKDLVDDSGVQTGYILFEYDEEGRCTVEEEFGMDDVSRRRWEYGYSDDGRETETRFYWQGEYTLRWIDHYDENGIRTEQRSYNVEDALTEIGFCDEEGNIVHRELYQGSAGAEWKYSEEELNENGMPVKANYFNEDGTPDGSFALEYDANGYESRNVYYNADGEFQWDSRSQYDENGNCVRREEYDEDGVMMEYTLMEYRSDGQIERQLWYNADDTLDRYTVTEYAEDGRPLMEKDYDAKDEQTGYTEYVYAPDGSYDMVSYRMDGTERFRMSYDADGFYIG